MQPLIASRRKAWRETCWFCFRNPAGLPSATVPSSTWVPPGSVDSKCAPKPSIIFRNGVLYHFCCAVSPENGRGISVATSQPVGSLTLNQARSAHEF